EDIGLGVDLKTGVRQTQARRYFADPDDRHRRIFGGLQRRLAKFTAERNAILMQNVAQTLGHSHRASQQNHFTPFEMSFAGGGRHFFDAAVEFLTGLGSYKK